MTLVSLLADILPFVITLGFAGWFMQACHKKIKFDNDLGEKSQATQEQIAKSLVEIKQLLEKK